MFCGQFEIHIRRDGSFFAEDSIDHILAGMILDYKGRLCTVCFDKLRSEVVFSFDESMTDDEDCLALFSFVMGDNIETIRKQLRIPKEYLANYPDSGAFIVCLNNAFCICNEMIDEV